MAAIVVHAILALGWSTNLSLFSPPAARPLQVSMFAATQPAQPAEQPPPPVQAAPPPVKPAPVRPASADEVPPPAPSLQASAAAETAPQAAVIDVPVTAPVVRDLPARVDTAYLDNPEPVFPSLSRRLGEEGRVLLQVRVGSDGSVLGVLVSRSSGYPRLDNAATRAVAHWRFLPARVNGITIESTVTVPINFSLDS
ncbi:MAG: energy transducer TonB [Gammaproteobacteria bacterium]